MRGVLFLLCAIGGGIAGGIVVDQLRDDGPVRSAARTTDTGVSPEAIDELRNRIELLERHAGGRPETTPATPTPVVPAEELPEATPKPPRELVVPADILTALDWTKTRDAVGFAEANALFGWLTNNKGKIKDYIKELEAAVKADPQNAELRVALATAWVAELTNNTAPGPQQGMVWIKAKQAYDEALEINPEHWQARYGRAFGVSMMPEFLGQRPTAIREFEALRVQQERGAPEPHHVHTYFQLGTLYKNMGNAEKAREIWDHGLKLFPESPALKDALDVSTKR